MKADIRGALKQLNTSWRAFEHRGKEMTKEQVRKVLVYALQKGYKNTGQLSDEEVDEIIKKFQNGDKAIVGKSVDLPDFLKHALKEGEEVEIAERYTKWKGKEAYILKDRTGRIMTEYLLAEELNPVKGGSLFDKYKKAGFDCLFFFNDGHKKGKWCCGFFCQGKESILNDGLICYLPLQGKSESKRDKHLSKLFDTAEEAINDSYTKWKNKH